MNRNRCRLTKTMQADGRFAAVTDRQGVRAAHISDSKQKGGKMKIELDDSIMEKIGVKEEEALEFLAIALYKYKGVHGSLAGKLIGKTEFDFHSLVSNKGSTINYDVDNLVDDIKNNDL